MRETSRDFGTTWILSMVATQGFWHAVCRVQAEFGGNVPDGGRDGCTHNVFEHGDGGRSCEDEEGSASEAFDLSPPNLASIGQVHQAHPRWRPSETPPQLRLLRGWRVRLCIRRQYDGRCAAAHVDR